MPPNAQRGGRTPPHRGQGGSVLLERALRAMRPVLAVMLVFSFFANVLRLTIPLYMFQIFDRVMSSRSVDTLIYLTLIAVLAILVGSALAIVGQVLQGRLAAWFERQLATPVLSATLDGQLSGRSMGQQTLRDLHQIKSFIAGPPLGTLLDAPWVPLFIFVIFLFHYVLGLVALTAALVLVAVAVVNDLLTRRLQQAASEGNARTMREVDSGLRHATIVHSMGLMPSFLGRVERLSEAARETQNVVHERSAMITGLSRFIRQGAQIVIMCAGAYLVVKQEATVGVMIAGSFLLSSALSPVDRAMGAWRGVVTAWGARRRLIQQLAAVPQRSEGDHASEPGKGHLVVHQATYIPLGRNRPVLRPMTFEVLPGEILGVLGPGAAGKSTLAQLLVGALAPSSGSVQLDKVDLHEQLSADMGRNLGYLPQDPMLFPATVAENIARLEVKGGAEFSRQLVEAAQLASVHEAILNLPQRYETPIDDNSLLLSRSERQRIALARAFFGRPKLIVLDEPTTFLDRAGEATLIKSLRQLRAEGSTIVLVTQRPTLFDICDKLLLLRAGMIEAYGAPERVLARIRSQSAAEAGAAEPAAQLRRTLLEALPPPEAKQAP